MKGNAAVAGQRRHPRGRVWPPEGQWGPCEGPIAPRLRGFLPMGVPTVHQARDGSLELARHRGEPASNLHRRNRLSLRARWAGSPTRR